MAKDDDTGEFEQIGGADWLLNQLRGDRSAEESPDDDADDADAAADESDALPSEAAPVEDSAAAPEPVTPAAEEGSDPFAAFARPAEPSVPLAPAAEPVAEPAPAAPAAPPAAPAVEPAPEPFVPVEPTIETLFAPSAAAEVRAEPLAPPAAVDPEPRAEQAVAPEPLPAEPIVAAPTPAEPVFRRESPADYFSTAPLVAPDEPQRESEPQSVVPEPTVESSLPASARESFTAPVVVTPEPVVAVAPAVPAEAAVPVVPVVPVVPALPVEEAAPVVPAAPAEAAAPVAPPAAEKPHAEPAAPAPAAGGFQWGLAPSDDPDPIVAGSSANAAPVSSPVAPAPFAPAVTEPDVDDEVRLAPQTEEPLETVAIDLTGTGEQIPFSPVAASEAVNADQSIVETVAAPSELFEPVTAEADDAIELPDALADAMALPNGEPGAAAFGRPPAVPFGSASDGSPWFAETAPIDVLETPAAAALSDNALPDGAFADPALAAGIVPAVSASDVARGAEPTPAAAREGFVPIAPAQGGGNDGGSTSSATPGAGVPKPLLWAAGALLMVLVLVGLFFLGTRLGGGAPVAEPSPSPSPSADASAEPTAPVLPTGTQPPGEYAWNELGGGECLDPFGSPWDETFTVVDCAAPHAGQLVLRSNYGDTSATPFPGEASFAEQINAACTAPGVIDLAAAAGYGDVQVQGSYPVTEEEWTSGTAAYFCFVSRSSAEPLTSTLVPAA